MSAVAMKTALTLAWLIVVPAAALSALLSGCGADDKSAVVHSTDPTSQAQPGNGSSSQQPVTVHGPEATVVADVDCGEDGVANVHIDFGKVDKDYLVGRNSLTQSVGGVKTFSEHYGISNGDKDILFTVTTSPTTGTCQTTLTDYNTGDVLAQRSTSGKVRFQALFAG